MHIERATSGEIDYILDLMRMQFAEHNIGHDVMLLRSAIGHLLAPRGTGFILVAREEGRLLGIAVVSFAWTLEHGGRSAWLDELYVLPDRREEGIGTALLVRAAVEAESEGCLAIDLEVDQEHRRAENLYRREGFQELARRRWVKRLR